MKLFKQILTLVLAYCLVGASFVLPSYGASHTVAQMLNGSTVTFHVGTGDTAVTWAYNDAAGTTNRTFQPFGSSTSTNVPGATMSSGATIASFERPIEIWHDLNGNAPTGSAIQITS